jgi:hypothetical protein
MSAEDRDTKDKRGKAGIPDDEDRTKLRKKRWRIGDWYQQGEETG